MTMPKCFGKFRESGCDMQSCSNIQLCEEHTMCLADRIRLLQKISSLETELKNLREGICMLSGCATAKSRSFANQYGDLNQQIVTK